MTDADLPPLPDPDITAAYEYFLIDGSRQRDGYTADQMRSYAMRERAEERYRHRFDVHSCHQGCTVAGCVNERLRAEVEALRKDADELRAIGGQMAGVFFNWSQEANSVGVRLGASGREMLRGLLKQWDLAARRRPKQEIKGGL